jgi:hypothetical protein
MNTFFTGKDSVLEPLKIGFILGSVIFPGRTGLFCPNWNMVHGIPINI